MDDPGGVLSDLSAVLTTQERDGLQDAVRLLSIVRMNRANAPLSADYKSILSIDSVAVNLNDNILRLEPAFDYAVYGQRTGAAAAASPDRLVKLPSVSAWFSEMDAQLSAVSRGLRRLRELSVAVAVVRTAVERDLIDSFEDFASIHEEGQPSPSLICRSEIAAECDSPFFKLLLSPESSSGGL